MVVENDGGGHDSQQKGLSLLELNPAGESWDDKLSPTELEKAASVGHILSKSFGSFSSLCQVLTPSWFQPIIDPNQVGYSQ